MHETVLNELIVEKKFAHIGQNGILVTPCGIIEDAVCDSCRDLSRSCSSKACLSDFNWR
jgi:hypothetical protein